MGLGEGETNLDLCVRKNQLRSRKRNHQIKAGERRVGDGGWGEEKRGVGGEEGTGDNRNDAKTTENDDSADNDEDTNNKAVMQEQSADPETRLGEAGEEDKCGDRSEGEDKREALGIWNDGAEEQAREDEGST